ncbi:MAG: ASCH domain-containing protein [Cyanobacteria bacterium P01_F01_bin.56]
MSPEPGQLVMNPTAIAQYWQNYLQTLTLAMDRSVPYLVDQFGDTPELANELGQLVLNGTKTATCSTLWEWQAEAEPLPTVGIHTIVIDGDGQPLCIIQTTEVTIQAFNEVDAQFAYNEGEGDRTLASWRQMHWQYFVRVLPHIGKVPTLDMPLVCERFRVVFPSITSSTASASSSSLS